MKPYADQLAASEIEFCNSCGALRPVFDTRLDPSLRKCRCGHTGFYAFVGPQENAQGLRAILSEIEPTTPCEVVEIKHHRAQGRDNG